MNEVLLKDRVLLELSVLLEEFKRRKLKAPLTFVSEPIDTIPLSIFDQDLGPLESLVFYLHHDKKQHMKNIAHRLLRHYQTIWTTYRIAFKKPKVIYPITEKEKKILENLAIISKNEILIPLDIFYNRRLSVFESLVKYLKESLGLNYHNIGILLHRNERTIWTIYSRANNKIGNYQKSV